MYSVRVQCKIIQFNECCVHSSFVNTFLCVSETKEGLEKVTLSRGGVWRRWRWMTEGGGGIESPNLV